MNEKGGGRQKRNEGLTQTVVKVWELNDFVVRLS